MSLEKYPFGSISLNEFYENVSAPKEIVRITGVSNVSPKFVNNTDESLWTSYWNNKSKLLDIRYIHGQDRFDKDKGNSYWIQKDIETFSNDVLLLTKSYNQSAKNYNKKIAEPFIKERKGLLNKIF